MNPTNHVQLLGNLGSEPELKTINTEQSVVSFSFATHYNRTNDAGRKEKQTEWHRCVAFGSCASLISKYLKKGSKAMLVGSLRSRSYEPKQGEIKYITEIVVSEVVFLDNKE